VRTEQLWVLCRPSALPPGEDFLAVGNGLALGGSREILEAVATAPHPSPFLLFLGYSGWYPGQLEQEIEDNSWLVAPLTTTIIFEVPLEERWTAALRSIGVEPGTLVDLGTGAPT
jgi:putative transcriptional regulator